jgi:lipid II:glycine glycyltransferase (peptidoglycan interpeptide bridge formation enzyme)
VYRFKEGFGARLVRTSGAWDLPLRPKLYWIYRAVLPRVMAFWRLRGRRQTRESIDA